MKSIPRVLMLATLPPPIHGAAMMTQYIKDSGRINASFQLDWVNISTSRRLDEIGAVSGWTAIDKLGRFSGSFLSAFWKLLLHKYDCCYLTITCHGKGFLKDAPFVLLCKLFRRKIVIHQHNKGMSNYVDRPFYCWLLRLVYKNTKVILLSWLLYPDIERIVKREDVMICPNGIKSTSNPDFEHKPNKIPHILFLSNLLKDKGVFVLLDALKILRDKGYSFVCDFVGSETNEIDAHRFKVEVDKRGLNTITFYHGKKYGKEKHDFFEKSDIFVLPTNNDTFALVNVEAMEYKLPIVTTNVGGIPDIVKDGENGFVVEPNRPIELADAINKLLDDVSLRKKMGEYGYQLFKSRYTADKFAETMIECLINVTRGGVSWKL